MDHSPLARRRGKGSGTQARRPGLPEPRARARPVSADHLEDVPMPSILPANQAEGRASTAAPAARKCSILFGNRTNQGEMQVFREGTLQGEMAPTPDSCLENPMDRGDWGAIVSGVGWSHRVGHD